MTTSEPSVEECLMELREMFPCTWFSIEVSWKPVIGSYYFIRIYGQPKQVEAKATLSEAMSHLRAWKQAQQR